MPIRSSMVSLLRPFRLARRDQDGVIAPLTAILATMLIGGLAITVDVAYWRDLTAQQQSIADATALAATYDLSQGVVSQATLNLNAKSEAMKNGCDAQCSVVVTWPYSGSSSSLLVTVVKTGVARYFSGIYSSAPVTITTQSIATGGSATTTTPANDSGCVLALGTSGTGVNFQNGASSTNPSGSVNANCEVISDSGSSGAIMLQNNAEIAGKATTPGTITQQNNWTFVGTPNAGAASIPDPYAGKVTLTRAGAGACADPVSGGNFQPINLSGSSGPGNNGTTQGSVPIVLGSGSTWTIAGGGHWCKGWQLSNLTLNLGPGTYIVDGTFNTSSVTINATSGVTLVWGDAGSGMNVNYNGSTTINITAPALGASAGIPGVVLTNYSDDPGGKTFYFNNNITLNWTGAVYLPKNQMYVQSGSNLSAASGSGGCGHVVTNALTAVNRVTVGNKCTMSMGVQPFGTTATGWATTTTTTSGSGAHPRVQG